MAVGARRHRRRRWWRRRRRRRRRRHRRRGWRRGWRRGRRRGRRRRRRRRWGWRRGQRLRRRRRPRRKRARPAVRPGCGSAVVVHRRQPVQVRVSRTTVVRARADLNGGLTPVCASAVGVDLVPANSSSARRLPLLQKAVGRIVPGILVHVARVLTAARRARAGYRHRHVRSGGAIEAEPGRIGVIRAALRDRRRCLAIAPVLGGGVSGVLR